MLKRIIILILLASICQYTLAKVDKIVVASEEWEGATNKDGTGLYWDIIKEVFQSEGVEVVFQIYPYERAVHMVETGEADAWCGSYADEEEFAIYPKYHFDYDLVTALFLKKYEADWKGEESLKGKNVGWIRGYDYDQYLKVEMKSRELSNRSSALKLIAKERMDYFLDAQVEIESALAKNLIDKSLITTKELLKLKLFLAFIKSPKGKELIKIWDRKIEEMIKSGRLKKIYAKHDYADYPF